MRVMTIQGSPRKNGSTATLLREFEEEVVLNGHEVERVEVRELALAGCLGCGACQKKPTIPGCVQMDGGNAFYERLAACEAVVYAAPLYFWEFPAQMKSVIDRSLCLSTGYMSGDHRSLAEGARVGLLLTCGGPERGNADEVKIAFRRYSVFLKATHAGELVVPFCPDPDKLTPAMRERARGFARTILGLDAEEPPEEADDGEEFDDDDEDEEPAE
jgi:multimeric flavodoxin WrbA